MQVPKEMIVQFLRDRGKDSLADQAAQHLPEQVDLEQHAETLKRYGVDVPALVAKLPGPLRGLFG
ncbi:MAG: hypothetical protein QOC59_1591 [Microbacteriaceae bacterium]|jgi:hypothetical protein|nr:hypothetical protein [Microbacteriaceae bacterium]